MKTIVIFSWFYLPFIGGAELFVKAITDRLGYRYRFVIVTARADRKLAAIDESERVSVVRVGLGNRSDKFMYPLFALKWALASEHVDLVHAIMVNASAVAAYLFSKMKRVPTLLTLQEGDTEDYAREYLRLLFPVYPRLHRTFDRIHAISRFLACDGRVLKLCHIFRHGVDVLVFSFSNNRLFHILRSLPKQRLHLILRTPFESLPGPPGKAFRNPLHIRHRVHSEYELDLLLIPAVQVLRLRKVCVTA